MICILDHLTLYGVKYSCDVSFTGALLEPGRDRTEDATPAYDPDLG